MVLTSSSRRLEQNNQNELEFKTNWYSRSIGGVILTVIIIIGLNELCEWQNVESSVFHLVIITLLPIVAIVLFYHTELTVDLKTSSIVKSDKFLSKKINQRIYSLDAIENILIRKEPDVEGGSIYNIYFVLTNSKKLWLISNSNYDHIIELSNILTRYVSKQVVLPNYN